jgi:hypothetical protein
MKLESYKLVFVAVGLIGVLQITRRLWNLTVSLDGEKVILSCKLARGVG